MRFSNIFFIIIDDILLYYIVRYQSAIEKLIFIKISEVIPLTGIGQRLPIVF